jgi:hypothetical protein
MRPSTTLLLLPLLLACGDKDEGSTHDSEGADSPTEDSADTADTGDSEARQALSCTFVGMDRLVFDLAGGDEVGVTLECDDATRVGTPLFSIPELGIERELVGEAQSNGTTWKGKGKSLSELEELVADKGLSFGMDVSRYDLDSDQVAPPSDNLSALGVRFHDERASFGDTTNAPELDDTIALAHALEVVVLEVERGEGDLDLDGDGGSESLDLRALAYDAEEGLLALDGCLLDGDPDGAGVCDRSVLVEELPTELGPSTHAVYGGAPSWQSFTLEVQRASGKGSVSFGLALPGPDSSTLHTVQADQTGASRSASWSLPYDELGLASSSSSEPDLSTAPVLLDLIENESDDGREAASSLTALGVGSHLKDGSTVFFGAEINATKGLASSWTASSDWGAVHTEAARTLGGELVVFGGTGDLEARSFDLDTGDELSHFDVDESEPLAIASSPVDLDGAGAEELLVAWIGGNGELSFLHGQLSREGGLSKVATMTPEGLVGAWSFDDSHAQDASRLQVGADAAGNVAVVLTRSGLAGTSTRVATWMNQGKGSEGLASAPDTDELVVLDGGGVILESGGDTCPADEAVGSKQRGFCGRLFSERQRHEDRGVALWDYERLVGDGAPVRVTSLDWRGEEPRGLPLVDTKDFVVVAIEGGVQVFNREGKELGEALELDAGRPLSAAQIEDELLLFGAEADGTLQLVRLQPDGVRGETTLQAEGGDFRIPDKVVMEKEADFYGLGGAEPTGVTVSWKSYADEDGDGELDSATLSVARVDLDELPNTGSQAKAIDAAMVLGGGGHESVSHAFSRRYRLGAVYNSSPRSSKVRRPPSPTVPLANMAGVEPKGALSDAGQTDDVVALVPWDTGTACPYATVFVPGTRQDWSSNVVEAIVLSTSEDEDCSDLLLPVGRIDTTGEGVDWPLLAEVDTDAGTTSFRELVWDGEQLLLLPGARVEALGVDAVDIGDFDGDGLDELSLRFYKLRRDNVMNRLGRDRLMISGGGFSLGPFDPETADFDLERVISYEELDGLGLEGDFDVFDSQDEGLDGTWFYAVSGLGGQETLGNCRGTDGALSSCGWTRDQDNGDRTVFRSAWNAGGTTRGAYTYTFWLRPQ